jgi:lipoyl(octanoyl) transferase
VSAWRFVRDPPAAGAWNMAVDEAIAAAVGRAAVPPTLRLYGWQAPTVSLGYGQRWDGGLDREACRRLGVGLVRRPTGGRAVLHAAEITYSASVPLDGEWGRLSVEDSFVRLCEGLLAGLRRVGIEAALGTSGAAGAHRPTACFQLRGLPAIVVGERKLVGSAQRRWERSLLQHGSILLRFDPELHGALFSGWTANTSGGITCLADLKPGIPPGAIEEALLDGWADNCGPGRVAPLSPEEQDAAARLVRERYGNPEWTFRR